MTKKALEKKVNQSRKQLLFLDTELSVWEQIVVLTMYQPFTLFAHLVQLISYLTLYYSRKHR